MSDPNEISLERDLTQRMLDLKRRSEACGSSLTGICRDTGVARATVERWADRAPQTIKIFDRLLERVQELERETVTKLGGGQE